MKHNAPSGDLRSRVFRVFLLFAFLMLAVLWLLQTVFLDHFYRAIRLNRLYKAADYCASHLMEDNYYPKLLNAARNGDFCVIVAHEKGILYSVDVISSCIIHRIPDYRYTYFLDLAREGGGDYLLRINMDTSALGSADTGIAETVVYSRIVTKGDADYCIILNAVIEPIGETVTTLRIQLLFISAFFVVLSAILAYFLSKSLSRPLVILNRKSKRLGREGAPDFRTAGFREVEELGETLEAASRDLQKTDRLQKELVANISHDLRTPLTMIAGYAEVMRDIPGENNAENAQIIIDEAKRLSTIVTDVLDVSRIQAGTEPMVPERFDLTRDTEEIVKRFAHMTGHEGYHFTFYGPEEAVFVEADRIMISRVIYNLVNNAVTHAGKERRITVFETVTDAAVRISVCDDGEGIAPEELDTIWDRYYKVDREHKRAAVGSGLGLSIVKTILSLHRATYGVESTVGEGSRFWFELKINR